MTGHRRSKQGTSKRLVQTLEKVKEDAIKFLTEGQWLHVYSVIKRLEDFGNRRLTSDLRIEKVNEDIWELKLKGNALGKINVRVFFSPVDGRGEVVVLGVFKKEAQGQIRPHRITKMETRLSYYLAKLAT